MRGTQDEDGEAKENSERGEREIEGNVMVTRPRRERLNVTTADSRCAG